MMTDPRNGDEHTTATKTPVPGQQQNVDSDASVLLQTRVRKAITPYLPPPVIHAMKQIDPALEFLVGPEASISLVGSFFLAYVLFLVVTKVLGAAGGAGGKAIQDDDADQNILQHDDKTSFEGTIVLCGPSMGGKTTLFYHLIHHGASTSNHIRTVKSIKSNMGFMNVSSDDSSTIWRVVDTPGHWGPEKLLQAISLAQVQRVVLVVDSTQPVATAADYLYVLWTAMSQLSSRNIAPQLLITCHKSRHPKAKNTRRLKLQLRSELDRLQKLQSIQDLNNNSSDDDKTTTRSTDWEQVLNQVWICSSDITDQGMKEVTQFCQTGIMPNQTGIMPNGSSDAGAKR
jgi:signal recognition particle receptor subunit beta